MKKIFSVICVFIFLFLISNPKTFAYGWGFSKNDRHETPEIGIYKNEIEGTNSYYLGDETKKEVYLTFDAGYDNGVLSGILDILKEKNEEGYIIGNHTWGHKNITKISYEKLKEEIEKIEDEYYKITGKEMIKFFRPPEGEFTKAALENVSSLGYKTFFWSIAYKDWETNNQRGGDYGYNAIMNNIHNGAIILMHTVSKDNLECLPRVIDDLRNDEYLIKNLDEMSY